LSYGLTDYKELSRDQGTWWRSMQQDKPASEWLQNIACRTSRLPAFDTPAVSIEASDLFCDASQEVSLKLLQLLALDNPFTDPVADGKVPPPHAPQGLRFAIHHQPHPVSYLPDPEREPRSTRQGQSLVVVLRSSCRCARREMSACR
jgi:hypothetical protein